MSIRAFELTPAIQRVKLTSGPARTQIECLECCGRNIYIGTNDCFVVHYMMEETVGPAGRVLITTKRQSHKHLALKKPVADLKVASALNRILVLCDNTLSLLNMFDLEPILSGAKPILSGAKVRGVVSVCVNRQPVQSSPFSVEICVALKKKSIQVYTVTEDRFVHTRDVGLPENPVTMSMSGRSICVACTSQYLITNYDTGQTLDLFPYEADFTRPSVVRVAKDEFLLSGPSALGMFVTSQGISQRPPLQWSDHLISVTYHHPYILAMNDEFITVHSILDQQQKQAISFTGGKLLGEFDGRVLVATDKEVLALVPVAVEKQIQNLLAEKRVGEALEIAKNARSIVTDKAGFGQLFRQIEQQAGFCELSACRWDEARQLFKAGEVDAREVISLYPGLLVTTSQFNRQQPPLHDIANIDQLSDTILENIEFRMPLLLIVGLSEIKDDSGNDLEKMVLYNKFLVDYLEDVRETSLVENCRQEVDTALLKLYAASRPHELLPFLAARNHSHLQDCVHALEAYGCYYALGMMYKFHGDMEKALSTWTKIVDGQLHDSSFPGINFVVEILSNLEEHDLVWRYVEWALSHDQKLGITILTERPDSEKSSDRLHPDAIIDYLDPARFSRATILYLEYLVFRREFTKEKYHTHLALSYLDEILLLQKRDQNDKLEQSNLRQKLQRLLRWSSYYRVQVVLNRLRETDLYLETAILHGKLEDHEQALRILVHKLGDHQAAREYCTFTSQSRDGQHRRRLFHMLLAIYLDTQQSNQEEMVVAAMDLLNSRDAEFDVVKVIQQIPDSWSAGFLEQFLTRSVRETMHRHRMTRIECQLSRVVNLQHKQDLVSLSRQQVDITEKKSCAVCQKSFHDAEFTYFPNGAVTHTNCTNNITNCQTKPRTLDLQTKPRSQDANPTSKPRSQDANPQSKPRTLDSPIKPRSQVTNSQGKPRSQDTKSQTKPRNQDSDSAVSRGSHPFDESPTVKGLNPFDESPGTVKGLNPFFDESPTEP